MSIRIVLSYLVIYIVWGSTYLFIKMGVETMPTFYLVGGRFFLGGVAFLLICLATGKLKTFPAKSELLSSLFLGVVLLLLGNGFVSLGERTVDSYLAALIVSSTPFAVAVFNGIFFRERPSFSQLAGMLFGVLGVGLILYNGTSINVSITSGTAIVTVGLIFWALATSLGHKMKVPANNLVSSGLQMFFAGSIGLVLSAIIYPPIPTLLPAIAVKSWIGLLYLALLGGVAFYCYSYLLKNEPSIRVVSYAIVNPPIAVLLGIFIGHEKPTQFLLLGLPLVLAGLVLMLYGRTLFGRFHFPKLENLIHGGAKIRKR
jgi:drug/metabolite transporter (DMT)-like permease